MPPRKEPKENVVYAASKRKAPPFKPQRPSKVPRIPTTESEASTTARPTKRPLPAKQKPSLHDASDDESEKGGAQAEDSDEELADNPLTAKPRPAALSKKPPPKPKPARQPSPMAISDDDDDDIGPFISPDRDAVASNALPGASQSDESASIPQNLLTRLLHEHFADKTTQIDKQAIQVFQKYIEVFVREAIARSALANEESAEEGAVDELGGKWLEREDLEKAAGAMMLDF